MNDTRSEIVRLGDMLIRTKGYNAFSYADIAEVIKIKKATIHYYFPSKSDLGVEIIKNTISNFKVQTTSWTDLSYNIQFKNWIAIYEQSKNSNWVCVIGALSPVYDTLSNEMKSELERLANMVLEWLTILLAKGREAGIFHYTELPETKAYLIQSSLLASLLLNKVLKKDAYKIIENGILIK